MGIISDCWICDSIFVSQDPTSTPEQYLAIYSDAVSIVKGTTGSGIPTIGSTRAPDTLEAKGNDANGEVFSVCLR